MHWILIFLINPGYDGEGLHNYDFDSKETCVVAGQTLQKWWDEESDTKEVTHNMQFACVQK